MIRFSKINEQVGFTLVEIIVSTAIFIVVVSSLLSLFNQTLQINRRVQALREVVQGTRNFTETISREVRNGHIDYKSSEWTSKCPDDYSGTNNQSLAILARNGDRLCFYLENDVFYLKKKTPAGIYTEPVFGSTSIAESKRFKINSDTFRFYVRPVTNPNPEGTAQCDDCNPGIQPFVTIVAQFQLNRRDTSNPLAASAEINYQTTISTDVYDIYRRNN